MPRSVVVLLVAAFAPLVAGTMAAQTPPRSVWSGVFSTEQAARGKALYVKTCSKCHGDTLFGGDSGPALVGKDFLIEWDKQPVGALYDLIRTTMPDERPGSMTSRQYTDLTAYLLSENAFPAGKAELPSDLDAMMTIEIGPKP